MGLIEVMREQFILPLLNPSSYDGNKENMVDYLNHQLEELDYLVNLHFTPRLARQRLEDNHRLNDYLTIHLPEVCETARPYCPKLVVDVEKKIQEVRSLVYPMSLQ